MTIKEIESLAGMSRANVRFYEAEGLLAPARLENGYRSYSEADLAELRRIKLLRTLGVPLEELRALQSGETTLDAALSARLAALTDEQDELELAKELCRSLLSDGAAYGELDAEKYLLAAEKAAPPAAPAPVPSRPAPEAPTPPELKEDVLPRVRAPWRRFFARMLDDNLCAMVIYLLLIGVFNVRPFGQDTSHLLVLALFTLLFRLFTEPLFLTLFRGTPGKLLLGLRVTDNEGRRLSYRAALSRTVTVFIFGEGLRLPIVHIVLLVKSYKTCMSKYRHNAWEYDTELTLRDERLWRIFAWWAVLVMTVVLPLWAGSAAAVTPLHTGELTVAEFSENFNRLADYNRLSFQNSRLNAAGEWVETQPSDNVVVSAEVMKEEPDFVFTEEDGRMTGLHFAWGRRQTLNFLAPSLSTEASLAIRAYAGALAGTFQERRQLEQLLGFIERSPFDSLEARVGDVRIVIECSCSGVAFYQISGNYSSVLGKEYSYSFTMTRAG